MKNIICSILLEFGPCSINEILDYMQSDLFYQKGYFSPKEWTRRNVQYQLDKICKKNNKIFKFQCNSGYKVRYGTTKFNYYLLQEPRFLKSQGDLKHCMFCGMPIYINSTEVFHFKYKCNQYQKQEYFNLLKVNNFWGIISRDFVYGILDDLHSCVLRLPGTNHKKSHASPMSELWLINQKARKNELIESDRLLPLKAEEFIA